MLECEDCSINGLDCQTHGRTIALPAIERLLELTQIPPMTAADREAANWLEHLREQYADD